MTGWGEYFGNDGTDSVIFVDGNYDDDDDNYDHDGDHQDSDDDDDYNYDYSDDHYENDDDADKYNYDGDRHVPRPRRLQRRHGGRGDSGGFDPRSSLHHTIEARLLALCQEGEDLGILRVFSEVFFLIWIMCVLVWRSGQVKVRGRRSKVVRGLFVCLPEMWW